MRKTEFTELGIKLLLIHFLLSNFASLPALNYFFLNFSSSDHAILVLSVAVGVILVLFFTLWGSAGKISALIWRNEAPDPVVVSVDARVLTAALLSVAGILIAAQALPGFLGSLAGFIQEPSLSLRTEFVVDYQKLATLAGRLGELVIGLALILDVRRVTDFIAGKWENPFGGPESAPKAKKAKGG